MFRVAALSVFLMFFAVLIFFGSRGDSYVTRNRSAAAGRNFWSSAIRDS